ncbi:MAG: leucyl aminopeptidase [Pseudomonadota bacterium]
MSAKENSPKFSIKTGSPEKLKSDCIVAGVFEEGKLSASARALDGASGGRIAAAVKSGDMDGRAGSTLLLRDLPGVAAARVLLAGLGKEGEFAEKAYRDAVATAVRTVDGTAARDALITLTEIEVGKRGADWNIAQAAIASGDALYRFERMKSKVDRPARLGNIGFLAEDKAAAGSLKQGAAIVRGMSLARDLGNTPSNVCTPLYLADQARELAKTHGFKCKVMDRAACEKLGMGSFLSVAKGSDKPPMFIELRHDGGRKGEAPIVLVGKAITFDAGGISLKPAADMDEMNYDMSGGGAVLGVFRAIGELGLDLNVVGLIPACENLPDAHANKPGDIVTSMSGQTIEILNTDAEGRLILCDALTYAERFKPAAVVDLATLTGACVIALGHHPSALYANDDKLAQALERAADHAWDRVWRMPLWDEYQEQLKSNLADMANIGGRAAGSVTAACFLSRFARNYPWAHLDIAGTAYRSGRDKKGSTGRPVPLLVQYLIEQAGRRA